MDEHKGHENDLPLMSNSHRVLLHHFILDLKCLMDEKVLRGSITLFLQPAGDDQENMHVFSIQEFQARMRDAKASAEVPSVGVVLDDGARNWGEALRMETGAGTGPCSDRRGDNGNRSDHQSIEDSADGKDAEKLHDPLGNPAEQGASGDLSPDDLRKPSPRRNHSPGDHNRTRLSPKQSLDVDITSAQTPTDVLAGAGTTAENIAGDGESLKPRITLKKPNNHQQTLAGDHPFVSPSSSEFVLILDCCDVDVEDVDEMLLPESLQEFFAEASSSGLSEQLSKEHLQEVEECERRRLRFGSDKWALRVWKPGVLDVREFPRCVKISYSTTPQGTSLRWTTDQDGRPCMYSAAMWINNRSLYPCQEYGSLSTWQASIVAPPGCRVLMSGDQAEVCTPKEDGWIEYYYQCCMALPSFTLAVAAGHWQCCSLEASPLCAADMGSADSSFLDTICQHQQDPCQIRFSDQSCLPCRLFAPDSLMPRARQALESYLPKSCRAVQELLGPSPFPRVDFVVYPSCSQDMAMSNPNLIFLSQSLLAADGSMSVRLAHELSHYWFGLLLGARDWTEEWLSEGFATYLEDVIHARAMQWTAEEYRERSELKALLRYNVLCAEMNNTSEELQTLRPNQGRGPGSGDDAVGAAGPSSSSSSAASVSATVPAVMYVKDGINPKKLFAQVHYLKGYFLLRHLANIVGVRRFKTVFKQYIVRHHGEMVSSQDFLRLAFDTFPELSEEHLTMKTIYDEWLDCPGVPKPLEGFICSKDNRLHSQALEEAARWAKIDQSNKRMRTQAKRPKTQHFSTFPQLTSCQLILLLEKLLCKKSLCVATLCQLSRCYQVPETNAEVRHRWCELVIKHLYTRGYPDVQHFLINDQAMGVYLYGEMSISGSPRLQELAKDCFHNVGDQMEPTTHRTVHLMLYGS